MTLKRFLCGVGCVALAWGQASAADPVVSSYIISQSGTVVAQAPAAMPTSPQTPARPAPAPATMPAADPMTQAPGYTAFGESSPGGTEQAASANPQMFGDSLSYIVANPRVTSPGQARPVAGLAGSAFKIADNEAVAPQDRMFLNTEYFTGVLSSLRTVGGVSGPSLRLSREVFGFEKTFLDGNASIEARVPFFQFHDDAGGSTSDFGDVTLNMKYAFVNNHCHDSDTVLSVGCAATLPTGPVTMSGTTSVNPTIIQPYAGYFLGSGDLFVHGFSSLAIPLSENIGSAWFNDIGVGYYAWRGCGNTCLGAIVPTIEGHLTTPLGNIGANGLPIGILDTFVLTGGVSLIFTHHADLTLGYEFPISGPEPFLSEYVLQFNWRY